MQCCIMYLLHTTLGPSLGTPHIKMALTKSQVKEAYQSWPVCVSTLKPSINPYTAAYKFFNLVALNNT